MTALGQAFFLLCSCSFQSSLNKFSSQETPSWHSHPSVLQSFTPRLLDAEKCPESPRQDHNLQHRSLVHVSGAHKAHTILKLLPPISPSGMPHKKEFRPNWAFHPLPAFQGTAGQGQRSLPGLLDSVCAPSSPPLCNYD